MFLHEKVGRSRGFFYFFKIKKKNAFIAKMHAKNNILQAC
jgi:hypothetical protein